MSKYKMAERPAHLGRMGSAVVEPAFSNDMSWYEDYLSRHAEDGAEARLVSYYTFTESWESWEVHPKGAELVLCVAGTMVMHQEHADGSTESVSLSPGEYAINPPGTWHTADVETEATALFITAGEGTEHRPR